MNNYIYKYITEYFTIYLKKECGLCENTIQSYKYSFILFFRYFKDIKKIEPSKLKLSDLTHDNIISFLDYLISEKKNTISTQNSRLIALKSFNEYLNNKEIEYFANYSEIKKIKQKKTSYELTNYLTKEELKKLFDVFDYTNKKQMKDYTIITLLYDCGARVSELINLNIYNIDISKNIIVLNGKGNKKRINPLSKEVSKILKKYIEIYNVKESDVLFTNTRGDKYTKEGIKYILRKYAGLAGLDSNKISPHSLRHTKAMHMLENNINLIYIRDFLGHASVTTTERYARANPEMRRKAIEDLSNEIIENKDNNINESDLLDWLENLK